MTYVGHFLNMSIYDDSRTVLVFSKKTLSENQRYLDSGVTTFYTWILPKVGR